MSNSPLVEYVNISPYKNKRNHVIDTITIHCMSAPISIEACGNLFQHSESSSNYGIGADGRIALYVPEDYRSWATYNRANDHRAITIEVACNAFHPYAITNKAYKALVKLLDDVRRRNGIQELKFSFNKNERMNHVGGVNMTCHRDYKNKACPGDYIYYLEDTIAKTVNSFNYGNVVDPHKYKVTKEFWVRTSPQVGTNANKVKFSQIPEGLQKKCYADENGFAKIRVGKTYTRMRKYTKGDEIWHQDDHYLWFPARVDGKSKTKRI